MIKQLKRIQRIKELYSIIVTIPTTEQGIFWNFDFLQKFSKVQRAINEVYIQSQFLTSYTRWHDLTRERAEAALTIERERRAELSDIQNTALRRLISRVKLPRANQDDIGALRPTDDGIIVLDSDTKGKDLTCRRR